uniref:galactosylgalactosylxylosylprotein 3-beta-glucuronosyltransferase 3-like n=1 Tax=Styela clava TaxID=7725 RepID=UPI001939982B|nr:galactosylgalactosylxylosylprotein 3-beta-glucuronosyltransferase 3-like [Styela clava]
MEFPCAGLPTIYAITPTYTRWTQKAELTRLCHTFLHVPNFFWIIVEDSEAKTDLVARFLRNCGLPYAHVNAKTDSNFKLKSSDPSWLMPRGVAQRNEGLKWIRKNVKLGTPGVLYFVDDDNTYSLRIFEEMRFTKTVSVWPVGLVGGLKFEGPLCKNGKVMSFYTAWKPERPYPIDMAGFATNIELVLEHPEAVFSNEVPRGYQESHFLSKIVTREKLEPKDCSKILVWHTRTEKPNMKQEMKLQKIGKASDPKMEV